MVAITARILVGILLVSCYPLTSAQNVTLNWDGNTLVDGYYILRTQQQSTNLGSGGCASSEAGCITSETASCIVGDAGGIVTGADSEVSRAHIGNASKLCGCNSKTELLSKKHLYWQIKHVSNSEYLFSINDQEFRTMVIIRLDNRRDYIAIMKTPCCENTGGSDQCWHFGQHSTSRWDGHYAFTWCGTGNQPGA